MSEPQKEQVWFELTGRTEKDDPVTSTIQLDHHKLAIGDSEELQKYWKWIDGAKKRILGQLLRGTEE
jgi:hypothetical protein